MSHTPKHAMLIALSENLLSEAGTRRAMHHLEQCELCRHAHSGHTQRIELSDLARTTTTPLDVDYDRMSLALRQVARAEATRRSRHSRHSRHSRRALVNALAIAAALALVVFGGSRLLTDSPSSPHTTNTSATPTNTSASSVTPANPQGTPTSLASAAASTNGSDQHIPVAASDITSGAPVLDEGVVLRTEAEALRVPLWEGTEFTLLPGSAARVASFRNHRLQVELLRGSILNQVAPLQDGERYAIEANRHVVNVVGTRFLVSLSEAKQASVELREGEVLVTRDGTQVASLVAPASWREEASSASAAAPTAVPALKLIATETSLLDDGSPTPQERSVARPTDSRVRGRAQGSVAPKAVQHLMARAAPLLRKCHEAAKRTQPELPNRVELELTVGPDSHVTTVQVLAQGAELPEGFVACLRGHALKWYLPMTEAGPLTLRVPVQFATTPPRP